MDTGADAYVAAASKLRHDIESTRASLGDKIHALQHEVRGVVVEASDKMRGSIRHARDSVHPVVQFHRHPLGFCGAAFVFGIWLQKRMERRSESSSGVSRADSTYSPRAAERLRDRPGIFRTAIEGAAPYAVELLTGILLPRKRL